jgi:hypothetical protein
MFMGLAWLAEETAIIFLDITNRFDQSNGDIVFSVRYEPNIKC